MHEEAMLTSAIGKLASVMGRNLSREALRHWVDRLMPLEPKSVLYRILSDFTDGPRMPALTDVLEAFTHAKRVRPEAQQAPRLSEAERQRADTAAMVAILWLVRERNWHPAQFEAAIFQRAFNRMGMTAEECISIGLEQFSRDDVNRMMEAFENG